MAVSHGFTGNEMDLIDKARELYERGYSITPVSKNKDPIFGKGWQLSENLEWEKIEPKLKTAHGFGLVCGEISGVICLDIDILKDNEKLKPVREELLNLLPPMFSGRIGNPEKTTCKIFQI